MSSCTFFFMKGSPFQSILLNCWTCSGILHQNGHQLVHVPAGSCALQRTNHVAMPCCRCHSYCCLVPRCQMPSGGQLLRLSARTLAKEICTDAVWQLPSLQCNEIDCAVG